MGEYFVDASTPLEAIHVNRLILGDGYANGYYMCLAYDISYDGADWQCNNRGCVESDVQIEAGLSWDGTDYHLDIDLSNLTGKTFTSEPIAHAVAQGATSHASGPRYVPQARTTGNNTIEVRFIDLTDANIGSGSLTYVTTESTKMAFYLIIYGSID